MPGSPKKRARREAAAKLALDGNQAKTPLKSPISDTQPAKKTPQKRNADGGKPEKPAKHNRDNQYYIDLLCAAITTSNRGLKRLCAEFQKEDENFPSVYSFLRMFAADDVLAKQYARAKEDQTDFLADEIIEISDDDSMDMAFRDDGTPYVNTEHIQRSKLRVDSRKWIASKLKPKKYGDALKLSGDPENPLMQLTDDQIDTRFRDLLSRSSIAIPPE